MIRLPALLVVLALAACEPSPDAPATPDATPDTPEETAPVPSGPDTLALTDSTRQLAARPTAPLRIDGACPFEGCTYGTWTTSGETTVYRLAGDSTSAAFTIPAGTAVEADRGFVLLTRLGGWVAERDAEIYVTYEETHAIPAGDTVLVMDAIGEGFSRAWHGGAIGDIEGLFPAPGETAPFRVLAEPEATWWAHVRLADGREGWLWMDRTPPVDGADALG